VGLIRICETPDSGPALEIKPYLEADYRAALSRALPLLAETLPCAHGPAETRYLLAAAAALKGHPQLGSILNDLPAFAQCPDCGEELFQFSEEHSDDCESESS